MRCMACNKILTPKECSTKSATTGEYLDMCNPCVGEAGLFSSVTQNEVLPDFHDQEEAPVVLNDDRDDGYPDEFEQSLGG